MEEFLQLSWRPKNPSQIEIIDTNFLPEDKIINSYVYKNFVTPLQVKPVELKTKTNVFVAGKRQQNLKKTSCLSNKQQSSCLAALKICQAGKETGNLKLHEQSCLRMYNGLKQKINEENLKFLEYAKSQWLPQKLNNNIKPTFRNLAENCWKMKLKSALQYPQFYRELVMLPLTYDEHEPGIDMNCINTLLELGKVAKFTPPSLKSICTLKVSSLPNLHENEGRNSKLPVSEDANVKKLSEIHSFDVVISSGGLKKLMNSNNQNHNWDIPITVEQRHFTQENGQNVTKKIVFIDNPVPNNKPDNADFYKKCHKILLKANFCNCEAFSFPNVEIPLKTKSDENVSSGGDMCNETININHQISPNELQNVENVTTHTKTKANKIKFSNNKIHHNVSYRLWHIKQKAESNELIKNKVENREIKILVRCKLDACEYSENGQLQPLVIVPKLEHQLEFGGNIFTQDELSEQWTALFFHPFSNLCRVRINYFTSEVIKLEICSLQKVNNEAWYHHKSKPHLGLGVLYKILRELTLLAPGKYLLHHVAKHGAFVSLLRECSESASDAYDLHLSCNLSSNCNQSNVTNRKWCPIDTNLILPVHEAFNRMPGMFNGFVTQANNFKKGKKRKLKT